MAKAKKTPKREYTPDKVLENWYALVDSIPNMSEEELKACIDYELANEKRPSHIKRMFTRYAQLKKKRELKELFEDLR